MFPFLVFIASLVVAAHGFGDGAPVSVCKDLTPKHPYDPQPGTSPYSVSVDKPEIHPGEQVKVTLQGLNGETFKGFLLQARVGDEIVGSFKVDPNEEEVHTINCPGGTKNAVTHSNPNDKSKISINWVAPMDLEQGAVVFKATFVKDGATFWVGQTSSTLTIRH